MPEAKVILITGTRKGIGHYLAEYYLNAGHTVIGVSRRETDFTHPQYTHRCLDVACEKEVLKLFSFIRKTFSKLDVVINNAGIASMNHALLTSGQSVEKIFNTNVLGTFLFCREAAKLMQKQNQGRIINFTTVAVPLHLEGEAVYAASKSAVEMLTNVLAKEFSSFGITVNAIGPTPVLTDLIQSVPGEKIDKILQNQAIPRMGTPEDVADVIDFFISEDSCFTTGQVLYLGGV